MTNTQSDLIRLLCFAVLGEPLPEGFAPADADRLFRLAKLHDLAHLAAFALRENGLLDTQSAAGKEFDRQQMLAVWRVSVLERDLAQLRAAFERAGVDFIPLKGAVLRTLYPEPWMRPSADIDILVHADMADRAVEALKAAGWESDTVSGNYRHVKSPSGFHIDLHTSLLKDGGAACPPLETAWEDAVPVRDGAREHRLSDAMQYLFHMYHAAHHMRHGSCGVRVVLDTWLLNHRTDFDPAARRALLERSKLSRFSHTLETVAEAWFSGVPLDKRYLDAEAVLFSGGVYGEHHVYAARQAASGGGFAYLMKRAFPPRSSLRVAYPVLERHAWLLPACWAHRLFGALAAGKRSGARREMELLRQTRDRSRELETVFEAVGLMEENER